MRSCCYLLVALTLALCGGVGISAQEVTVAGWVADAQQRPLENATVVVSADSLAQQILGYTLTQPDGRFGLLLASLPVSVGWVTVRLLGYGSQRVRLRLRGDLQWLRFTLQERRESIGAVYVEGRVPDVEERGDTIVYNPVSYTLGGEGSIGDVVRRMPGLHVSEDGSVTYQGRAVEKVLINGRDVLASGSIAMNALPPDFASSIELLKDYTDDDIAHSFQTDQRLALNLKSHRKLTLSGTVEAGGGLLGKYEGRASVLSLLPLVSVTAMGNANNAGRPVLSLMEYMNRAYDLGSGSYSLQISDEETKYVQPRENEYRRSAGLGSVNVVWNPTPRYRLTSSSLYTLGSSGTMLEEERRYLLPEYTERERGTMRSDERYNLLSQHLKQRWKYSSRFSLDAKTTVDYTRTRAGGHHAHEGMGADWRVREDDRAGSLDLGQNLKADLLVGRGWIYLKGNGAVRQRDAESGINTDWPLLPFPHRLSGDGEWYALAHGARMRTYSVNGSLGGAYPVYERVHVTAEIRYSGQGEHTRHTAAWAEGERSLDFALMHSGAVQVGAMRNKGVFQFDAGVALAARTFRSSSPFAAYRQSVGYEPFAGITLRMSSQHELKLRGSRALRPVSFMGFAQVSRVEAYNQVLLPSRLTNPLSSVHELVLNYNFVRFAQHFYMWAEASYTDERRLPMVVTDVEGALLRRRYRDGSWRRTLTTLFSVRQGLGSLPVDVGLFAHLHGMRMNAMRGSQEGILSYGACNGKLSVQSRFKGFPLNVELSARGAHQRRHFQPGGALSIANRFSYEAVAHLQVKAFSFSATGKMDEFRYDGGTRRFADVDFTARYAWAKLTFAVTGHNLLHLRRDEWVEESVSDVLEVVSTYRRLPGYLLLSVIYRI